MNSFPRILVTLAALVLASCSQVPILPGLLPYKMEIQQGNFVTQEMVSRLKAGMSREQVRFVMGTPLVADIFHADRWDYVYSRVPARGGPAERRLLVLYFEDNKLARLEGDVVPQPSSSGAGAPPHGSRP